MMNELLKSEFLRRKRDNKNYSLRAFAAYLEIPAGRLSEILSGKRPVSKKMKDKLALRLGLKGLDELIENPVPGASFSNRDDYHFLTDDVFSVLADWYHFAILSLADTKDFRHDPKWIAKRLNISAIEATEALAKLKKLGLIEIINNKFKKTNKNVSTSSDIQSQALRVSHRQSIEQALLALNEVPFELRDITSITMAIDLKKIAIAKKIIKEFRLRMSDVLESGAQTEVYNLNIQLVPVSTRRKL
ncbi:TIGR02147 family protein [Bdellovibrio sp. HCB337]|uniref:TIGR02147 family protein n=1 Tax=Bdellovibrio sp. HCB337 TaxID=3394358 RepID=UPI0039A4B0C6